MATLRGSVERGSSDLVQLSIPPESGMVRFVRLVAVALARVHGVSDEILDDVRLATGEACARAITAQRAAGVIGPVRVDVRGGRTFTVSVRDGQPLPSASGMQAAELLRGDGPDPYAALEAGPTDSWLDDVLDDGGPPEAIGLIAGLSDDLLVETGPDGTAVTMRWDSRR